MQSNIQLIADSHVHIYPFMTVESVLEAASRNFFETGTSVQGSETVGLLVVADPEGVRGFERILEFGDGSGKVGGWRIESADHRSVTLRKSSYNPIVAIRGQQLISREGLEVLAIGHDGELRSGLRLSSLLEKVRDAGGLSVIAWGAGKWLGRRGRVITEVIVAESGRSDIMLGDNAGRPRCWSRVRQFDLARESGMRIVAGTDPLPIAGEESRIGGYGVRMSIECGSDEAVVDAFCRALADPDANVQLFGNLMGIGGFVSNQLRLRLQRIS